MRRLHGARTAAVVMALVAAGLGLAPAAGASAGPAAAVPQLQWRDCGDGFECARATVPRDYDAPGGATISLALIRLPAGDRQHRIGSLFVNPGGPGGSGVEYVRQAGRVIWQPQVRARFDIVGFDPRGVGESTPIHCFRSGAAEGAALGRLPAFPTSHEQFRSFFATWQRFDAACTKREAPMLRHVSTADVARDLDLLRRAVGDPRLTYDGVSYGSYLGQVYANLFPGKVRALVIDGVLDPVAWSTGRGTGHELPFSTRLRSADGAQATLREFFRACDAAGPDCAFSSGNPARKYAKLFADAKAGRLVLDGQPVTWDTLEAVTLGAMYSPRSWPDLAKLLQQLWAGDSRTASSLARLRSALGWEAKYQNSLDAGAAVFCTDSTNPRNIFAWPRAARLADRTAPYFGDVWTYISAPCATWPVRAADRYTGPWTARTANPVLVIGNRYDPATPYSGAVTAARLLPRSRLLTLNGAGHTALLTSGCIDRARTAYLVAGTLPATGTVCQPDSGPFDAPSSAARAAVAAAVTAATMPATLRLAGRG